MALIKCPECGQEISDTCDTCVHCGYKLDQKSKEEQKHKKKFILRIAAIVVLIAIIISCIVYRSVRTYSYYEEVAYYALCYFYTLCDYPEEIIIDQIELAPSITFNIKNALINHKKYYSHNIVTISYKEKDKYGKYIQEEYYIRMSFTDVDPYQRSLTQDEVYQDRNENSMVKINLNKIKYALEHPEVIS